MTSKNSAFRLAGARWMTSMWKTYVLITVEQDNAMKNKEKILDCLNSYKI